jgi:hypothetical protein
LVKTERPLGSEEMVRQVGLVMLELLEQPEELVELEVMPMVEVFWD